MPERERRDAEVASDVPPEGESAAEGVRRGGRQSRALGRSMLRWALGGAIVGALVGIVLGVLMVVFGPDRLVDGPPALVVIGTALAAALSGAVIAAVIALARWDGAEQREIDARTGRRGTRGRR